MNYAGYTHLFYSFHGMKPEENNRFLKFMPIDCIIEKIYKQQLLKITVICKGPRHF